MGVWKIVTNKRTFLQRADTKQDAFEKASKKLVGKEEITFNIPQDEDAIASGF